MDDLSVASTASRTAEPVAHGGDLDAARRRFSGAPEPWIDLSTGINPVPWPVPSLNGAVWSRLPQASDELALREAAARRYGVGYVERVVAAPGTQALIQIVPRLRPASRVAIVGPTYGEHVQCWRREGHAVSEVATISSARDADVIVLVNPDNPTGRVIGREELTRLGSELAARGGLLVVDEAFADALADDVSVAGAGGEATIVLRSFGKIYGLAGVRLGFAIAPPELAKRLVAWLGPWAVSGPALKIGRCALADEAWLTTTRERLASDARRLDSMLVTAGGSVLGGTPLFRLVAFEHAWDVAANLGRRGIHVRQFQHQPTWLRFGLPGAESEWTRLGAALGLKLEQIEAPDR